MAILSLWSRWRPDRRIQFDPEYQKAHRFKNLYTPTKAPEEYGWVSDYAEFIFRQFQSVERTLDEKAESVMKLFGGGTGLLTLGAIVNLPKISVPTMIVLGIAIVLALLAMLAAAWVRAPRQSYVPPSVAWALSYVENYEKISEIRFLAQWHLACEGLRLSLRLKVKGVRYATWLGYWSIAAVALSLVSAIIWPVENVNSDGMRPVEEKSEMASDTVDLNTNVSTPDPSGVSQTPDPTLYTDPQKKEKVDADPSVAAEPQSIQFPFDDGDAPPANQNNRKKEVAKPTTQPTDG